MARRSRSFIRTSIPLVKHVNLVNYTDIGDLKGIWYFVVGAVIALLLILLR